MSASRYCAALGPPVSIGDMGYRCTRPANHPGAHEAKLNGKVCDTWPRREDVERARRANS